MAPIPTKFNNASTLQMSRFAKATANPHRLMAENSKIIPNPSKTTITLQMGDPTIFGNFSRPKEAVEAIKKAAEKRKLELATEEQGPETESQPKRQKAPSSDSSMEISEVKPAPKPSNAASKAKSKAGGKTAGVTSLKTRSQARHTQMQKIKSTSYVVDSDDGMEGIEGAQEDHKQVIGE